MQISDASEIPSLSARLRELAVVFLQWEIRGFITTLYICSRNIKAGSLLSHTPFHRKVIIGQVLLRKQEPNWMPLTEVRAGGNNKITTCKSEGKSHEPSIAIHRKRCDELKSARIEEELVERGEVEDR